MQQQQPILNAHSNMSVYLFAVPSLYLLCSSSNSRYSLKPDELIYAYAFQIKVYSFMNHIKPSGIMLYRLFSLYSVFHLGLFHCCCTSKSTTSSYVTLSTYQMLQSHLYLACRGPLMSCVYTSLSKHLLEVNCLNSWLTNQIWLYGFALYESALHSLHYMT